MTISFPLRPADCLTLARIGCGQPNSENRKEYPGCCHGVVFHMEQGHYTESKVEGIMEPSPKEKRRVKKLWKTNKGAPNPEPWVGRLEPSPSLLPSVRWRP